MWKPERRALEGCSDWCARHVITEENKTRCAHLHPQYKTDKSVKEQRNALRLTSVNACKPLFKIAEGIQWNHYGTHGELFYIVILGGLVISRWISWKHLDCGGWTISFIPIQYHNCRNCKLLRGVKTCEETAQTHQVTACIFSIFKVDCMFYQIELQRNWVFWSRVVPSIPHILFCVLVHPNGWMALAFHRSTSLGSCCGNISYL